MLISALNDDHKTLQTWLNVNNLSVNAIRTKCMLIALRQKLNIIPEEPDVAVSGSKIERVATRQFLF